MKPKPKQRTIQTLDSLMVSDDGALAFSTLAVDEAKPGFEGTLVPYYTLSDRGTFFVPGAFKKTIKEQRAKAQVLYQHDPWEPIGRFSDAFEDDKGFHVTAEVNEGVQRGAEVMSNLRFGVPLGLSVGFDTMDFRAGTEKDEEQLDRRTAPEYVKNLPITELTAITQARWWEGSVVTWGGIATAKPTTIHAAADELPDLLTGLKDGTLSEEQLEAVRELVAAYQASAAAGENHGTDELEARRNTRQTDVAAAMAAYAELMARRIAVA